MPPYSAHLLVVCHGLWGTRAHISYICDSVASHANLPDAPRSMCPPTLIPVDKEDEDIKLVVLPVEGNEWTRSYDGIDISAERVLVEIDDECKRIEEDGGKVTRFSIVGYSLGGCVARYVLGLLESRTPSFFDDVRPVNFTTFASPAIGVPRYPSFLSGFIGFLGSRLLSRTGSQLYVKDRFLPSSLLDGNNQPKSNKKKFFNRQKEKAEPLLKVMADPRYSFFKALIKFERVEIYANSIGDITVPFPSGAIQAHDPFALAQARAMQAAAAKGVKIPRYGPNIQDGGIELVLDESGTIITSYTALEPLDINATGTTKRRRFRMGVPHLLRPSTYPLPRPISTALIVCLPVTLPLYVIYLSLIASLLAVQSRASQRRIRDVRAATGGGREGMLGRVGVKLQEAWDDAAASLMPHAPELVLETSGRVAFRRHMANGSEDEVSSMLRPYEGTATPPLAKATSPDLFSEPSDDTPVPTDPILTPDQLEMIENLNSIPQMRKHLVYLNDTMFAHGMMVFRDQNSPKKAHYRGKPVIDHWAKEFRL